MDRQRASRVCWCVSEPEPEFVFSLFLRRSSASESCQLRVRFINADSKTKSEIEMNSINPKHVRYLENKSDRRRKSRIQSEIAVGMYSFPIRDHGWYWFKTIRQPKVLSVYFKIYFVRKKSLSLSLSSFLPAFWPTCRYKVISATLISWANNKYQKTRHNISGTRSTWARTNERDQIRI